MTPITRWTPRKKAEILALIDSDPTHADKLISYYNLSPEELIEWRQQIAQYGIQGLRTTCLQRYQQRRLKRQPHTYAHFNTNASRSTNSLKPPV